MSKYFNHFKNNNDSETKLYLQSKGIKTKTQLDKYLKLIKSEYNDWKKYKKSSNIPVPDRVYLTDFISDIFRGLIVLYIEIYYRSSHRFRGNDIEINLFPIDFVKFVNSFKISNIFNTNKNIKGCGSKLNCGGVPVYENNKNKNINFTKYVDNYEKDTGFYLVNKYGETLSLKVTLKKLTNFVPYIEDITIGNNCTNKELGRWNKKWFRMSFVPNDIIINDKKVKYISKKLNNQIRIDFLNYYFKDTNSNPNVIMLNPKEEPTFFYYNIKGQCNHKDVIKDLISYKPRVKSINIKKNNKIIIYGTNNCDYCKEVV